MKLNILFNFRFRAFVVILFSFSLALPIPEPPIFNCLAAYAKTKGINDPVFDAVDYDSSKEECVTLRHKFISNIRKEIRSKINEAEILPKYSKCIYEKMTGSEPFVNSIIKAAALEYSGQTGQLNNTVNTVLEYINSSVVSCKSFADLGDQFDFFFEKDKELKKNTTNYEEEYCIKKYLIKNNLIDTVLYEINPNPHNITITGLNCEALIRKSNDDIYEQLGFVYLENMNLGNIEKVECALEKFREADYFDLMMKITALTTIDIPAEQKSNEREQFIAKLSIISENVSTC